MYTTESQFTIKTDCGKEVEVRIVRYDSGMHSMLVSDYADYTINTVLQACVAVDADIRPEHLKAKLWLDGFLTVGLKLFDSTLHQNAKAYVSAQIQLLEARNALAQITKQKLT